MKNRSILLCLFTAAMISNCTNRALYEIAQRNNIQRCQELPFTQQAACQAQFQTSFDEYQREREALLETE